MVLWHIVSSIGNKKSFPHKTLNSYNLRICLWSCTKTIHLWHLWQNSGYRQLENAKRSCQRRPSNRDWFHFHAETNGWKVEKIKNSMREILKTGKSVRKKGTRRVAGLWCLHKSEKAYIVFEGGADAHTAHNSLCELHGQCRWLLHELSLNPLVAAVSSLEFFFPEKSCLHASKILQQHWETPQIQQQFRQQFRSLLLTTATAFVLPNRRIGKSQCRARCNWPSSSNFRHFHPLSSAPSTLIFFLPEFRASPPQGFFQGFCGDHAENNLGHIWLYSRCESREKQNPFLFLTNEWPENTKRKKWRCFTNIVKCSIIRWDGNLSKYNNYLSERQVLKKLGLKILETKKVQFI